MPSPRCRHFGRCGGCDWQHLTYAEQLQRKRGAVSDLLTGALGGAAPDVAPVLGMRADETGWPWRFRHKASFVFGGGDGGRPLTIGHYAASSQDIVPITECPVHADAANHIAFALHDQLARARVPSAGPSLHGVLRHLLIRTTRDGREAAAMLVVTRNDKALRRPIKAFLATADAPDGFYLNLHDRPGPYIVGRETVRLAGRSHVKETVHGYSYLLSPTAFFQTNVEAADQIVRLVLEAVPEPPQRVLDLYAGSGLFTVPLVALGHQVTAVEEHRPAVEDAEMNLRLNRLAGGSVRLHAGRVEEHLARLERSTFDVVVLDPPRQGSGAAVIESVFGRLRPARVVYVSCNAAALADELPAILAHPYDVERVQPVDMFPHTPHVETVVTFVRRSSRDRRAPAPGRPDSPRPRARRR